MRTFIKPLLPLVLSIVAITGCKKSSERSRSLVATSVIGIDPCSQDYSPGTPKKGYVLLNGNTGDVVVTYNLPVDIARKVDATFKLKNNVYFTDDTRVKVDLPYRVASDSEKVYLLCPAIVFVGNFDSSKQVIIVQ